MDNDFTHTIIFMSTLLPLEWHIKKTLASMVNCFIRYNPLSKASTRYMSLYVYLCMSNCICLYVAAS